MRRVSILTLVLLAVAGCTGGDEPTYTEEDLARFKQALPSQSTLEADAPGASAASFAFGAGDAIYPPFSVGIATNVNGLVGNTINVIEFVSSLPPTIYDSEDLEFWWGPIPDDGSPIAGDHVSLFIKDMINEPDYNPAEPCCRYEFAVIRGLGNDAANYIPIIYGAATPIEGTDFGMGVMIYDFDNNVEFENLHNPGHGPLTSGRMATIFAKGPDESNPAAIITFVVAAFRDFLPEDADVGDPPANVDYFWGDVVSGANTFDFLDFAFQADVDENGSALEDLDIKVAFFNDGIGRANVDIAGGDIDPETGAIQECWDASLSQTYLQFVATTNGGAGSVVLGETGNEADCAWNDVVFDTQIPDLEAAAPYVTLVDAIADAGIPSHIPAEND